MPNAAKSFTAVDARGDVYTIVVVAASPDSPQHLQTSTGRKVRKLSRGKYLVSHVAGEWNDIEVTSDDPSAP